MKTLKLKSPAKLNLFLEIRDKRSDGYHNIDTIFEKIDLCDTIRLTEAPAEVTIEIRNASGLPTNRDNLAVQAAELIKETYDIPSGVTIELEKNIPVAAGLGGGSSNAAAVLNGLNQLWNLNIDVHKLALLGGKLGADVPFFVFNYPYALGRGRGDEISPIQSGLKICHLLVCPPVKVSTRDVYENLNLNLTAKGPDATIMVRALRDDNLDEVKRCLHNTLEEPACRQAGEIEKIKDYFKRNRGRPAMTTGSGPTVFMITKDEDEAREIRDDFLKWICTAPFAPSELRGSTIRSSGAQGLCTVPEAEGQNPKAEWYGGWRAFITSTLI